MCFPSCWISLCNLCALVGSKHSSYGMCSHQPVHRDLFVEHLYAVTYLQV